ncbi:MAG TPA: (5-formylfuran-3-yl)methyl phosphate synthase [Phycisphaerae bacterium]|nr:(5-formylfuran-3-yl)methyl phosphate synthase [Phycisphaerae bacterium]
MAQRRQRLLISVRGPKEAHAAAMGGAHIADVEYPASALGTPYPLNILAVRNALHKSVAVSTNIGEEQSGRSTSCQAALGVALAGADIIKAGLGNMPLGEARELGPALVRTVKRWFPKKQVVPALFADERLAKWYVDPIKQGPELASHMKADGILIDTFDKGRGMGLLDYYTVKDIIRFAKKCHDLGLEAWLAGSIGIDELTALWQTGVDVICVRGAACKPGSGPGRFGVIDAETVKRLVETIP